MSQKTCVIYARVSPATMRETEGASLETQVADLRTYAAGKGWTVRAVVQGSEGGALSVRERPHLARALALLEDGDVLLVSRPDRLSRSMLVFTMVEDELRRAGNGLHFTGEEDEQTPEVRMLRGMLALFAEYERERIKLRTMRGKRASVEKGGRWGGGLAPFGLRYVDGPERVQVCAEEVQEVVRLRALVQEGAAVQVAAAQCRGRKGAMDTRTALRCVEGRLDAAVMTAVLALEAAG